MKYSIITLLLILSLVDNYAQDIILDADHITISKNPGTPHPSSVLDIQSTDAGILIPRMASYQINNISSPTKGLLVFDNNKNEFFFHNGTEWVSLSGPFETVNNTTRNKEFNNSHDFVFGASAIPSSGNTSANLFFFDESKAAFRSGGLINSPNWNVDSLGSASFASGLNTKADGNNSFASGDNSIASGSNSASFGKQNIANGASSTAVGQFNVPIVDAETFAFGDDPLFIVGNGFSNSNRSNALTVRMNGKVEINDAYTLPASDGGDGDIMATDGAGNISWEANDKWMKNGNFVHYNDGNVGIGTSTPNSRLHIKSPTGTALEIGDNTNSYITNSYSVAGGEGTSTIKLNSLGNKKRIELYSGTNLEAPKIKLFSEAEFERISIDGNQGIKLYNEDFISATQVAIRIKSNGSNSEPFIALYNSDGTTAIRLDADVNGDARITTDELEIKGGSDFAEHFDINDDSNTLPIPGMIVSIDPQSTGKLIITDEVYDKKVAGIISGANGVKTGLMMGQAGSIADGEYPIALTGRVYVYTNDEGGMIQPGDLLTTSSQKGYAMKVNDFIRAQGAIIGKAMTTPDDNGFVLVLVNLQ